MNIHTHIHTNAHIYKYVRTHITNIHAYNIYACICMCTYYILVIFVDTDDVCPSILKTMTLNH